MFDPLNPQVPPCVSKGNLFGVYPFPDESAHVCQIWCRSVQPFDSFDILLNLWPPNTPKMPTEILRGELYLAYVHSQTTLQTCTKFGANRSVWKLPQTFKRVIPKPPGILRGELYLAYVHSQTNPPTCTKFGANLCSRLTAFPHFWICDPLPPNAPGILRGNLDLAYVHSQMNPYTWTKFGANRSSSLTAPPDFWICDTLTPPPKCPLGLLRGVLYLAYVYSQMNPQMWTKVGANRTAFPDVWIVDPLKPPKCPPCVSRGSLFRVYPFPYESAHVCKIWCQSAKPFGSFSRICAQVSSAFRRGTRWLAQKHAKKQHLYIENYNSGPNMQTSTSLTFFTAIFVAFSGALAEELMIFCRHVRTELYI